MEYKKDGELEYVKAILYIFVVLGHAITTNIRNSISIAGDVFNIIYTFHMPVFFILSGIVYVKYDKKHSDKTIITKKYKRLIIPYCSMTIINYIVITLGRLIVSKEAFEISVINLRNITAQLLRGLVNIYYNLDKHIWYVYILFIIIVINILLDKINKKIVLVFSIVLAYFASRYTESNYMMISRIIYYNLYFILGRYMCNGILKKTFFNSFIGGIIQIVISIVCIYNIIFVKSTIIFYIKPIFLCINSLAIFGVIFNISKILNKKMNSKNILLTISKYGYEIYLLHNPFITMATVTIIYGVLGVNAVIAIFFGVISGIAIPIQISRLILRKNRILSKLITGK